MTTIENITAMRTRAWPFLLRRLALRTATACVLLMLLFVALRRVTGDFAPLAAWQLMSVGLAAVALALLWRFTWRNVEGVERWATMLERYVPAAALALLALALSIGGTAPLALVVFWLLLIGSEVGYGMFRQRQITARPHGAVTTVVSQPTSSVVVADETDEVPAEILPPGVSQQITRAADERGESLDCLLRVNFASGEQTVAAHIAFCPPLLHAPTATVEYVDGAPCDTKLTAVEVFGARLEVKRRGGVALEDEAIVRLHVVAPTSSSPDETPQSSYAD